MHIIKYTLYTIFLLYLIIPCLYGSSLQYRDFFFLKIKQAAMVETEAMARGIMVKEAMATMTGALEAAVATEVEATLVATETTGRRFH